MRPNIIIDWKVFAALGTTAAVFYCVSRMDPDAVERVLTNTVDAYREIKVAKIGDR